MTKKLQLLVVDDDNDFVKDFAILSKDIFDLSRAATGEEALEKLKDSEPDAVILDLRLGTGMDGIETLRRIRIMYHDMPVIMVTDHATVDNAVQAMKLGAFHYTSKHPNMNELHAIIQRELRQASWKRLYLEDVHKKYGEMIGDSPAMKEIYRKISHVAPTNSTVLIEGESGTGKELVAREIHARSGRGRFPFVPINCGAIPANLFESELFGHERGSFTGAITRQKGKFELADGGTIFLDEITNLSLELQAKLLRILEDMTFTRVGGNNPIQVNVRIVSASNKTLLTEVENGRFREDLYYRLNVVTIQIPPLRDRRDDIPKIAAYFAKKTLLQSGRKGGEFTPQAVQALKNYRWPGNIRELKNVIERVLILVPDRSIQPADMKISFRALSEPSPFNELMSLSYDQAKNAVLAQLKKAYLPVLLERNNGNITQAANEAGLPRSSLHRMLKEIT